jgi:hypothetical protein
MKFIPKHGGRTPSLPHSPHPVLKIEARGDKLFMTADWPPGADLSSFAIALLNLQDGQYNQLLTNALVTRSDKEGAAPSDFLTKHMEILKGEGEGCAVVPAKSVMRMLGT